MSDMRSVNNSKSGAADEYIEQIRQKIGTEFSDRKASGKKKNEMGKDDFVKLMSAQLKHQDPMSPVKNEQMAAQLAQFAALEQMVNMNTNLEKMTAAQRPQENVMAASLIGKRIQTESSKFSYKPGTNPEVKFELPADASAVNVALVDAKGEVIRDYELGSMKKGNQYVRWDGKNNKSLDATAGEYSYKVVAQDSEGRPMQIQTASNGVVTGVSFEGGKAMLLVGDRSIPMDAVGKIEADSPVGNAALDPLNAKKLTNQISSSKNEELNKKDVGNEKNTKVDKNSLPADLDVEKIKAILSSLGSASRMEASQESAGDVDGTLPMPLWNPGSL